MLLGLSCSAVRLYWLLVEDLSLSAEVVSITVLRTKKNIFRIHDVEKLLSELGTGSFTIFRSEVFLVLSIGDYLHCSPEVDDCDSPYYI